MKDKEVVHDECSQAREDDIFISSTLIGGLCQDYKFLHIYPLLQSVPVPRPFTSKLSFCNRETILHKNSFYYQLALMERRHKISTWTIGTLYPVYISSPMYVLCVLIFLVIPFALIHILLFVIVLC